VVPSSPVTPAATASHPVLTDASRVGIVLPDTADARWARVAEQFGAAMPGATIRSSEGSPATEHDNVAALVAQGIAVLIIAPCDPAAAAAEADLAHAAGVTVIAYGRPITGTPNVNYVVRFDPAAVGTAQAQYLVNRAQGSGNHLYLYTGAAGDADTAASLAGAWSVLQPLLADGTFTIENSSQAQALVDEPVLSAGQASAIIGQTTVGTGDQAAEQIAQVDLAQARPGATGAVFLLAPDDAAAHAIGEVFRANPSVTGIVSTGAGFTQTGLQDIMDGKQSMTVWLPDQALVDDCVQLVAAAQTGGPRPDIIVTTVDNGAAAIPATRAPLTIVVQANAAAVIADSGLYAVAGGKVVAR